jgi:ankyrin repeat protein
MHALRRLILAIAVTVAAVPAAAQLGGYDGELFVKAIREGNGGEALKLLQDKPRLVNARNLSGKTALIAAIENRDSEWTAYLLNKGADPNLADSDGTTPLMTAAQIGFRDAAEWLISSRAKFDATNRAGETALIIAVQRRQVPIVRLLVDVGADPDRTDSVAGYSARDYARRDSRTPELLRIIEAKKPAS